jgi:hypothetical protein
VSPLYMLQLFRILDVDRVREQVKQNPDFVNTARLKAVLEVLEAIRHTPLISAGQVDFLIQTAIQDIEGVGLSERDRHAEPRQYDTNFGEISTFVDLTSDLVTDEKIHAFLRTLYQIGAQSLCSDLGKRRGRKRKEISDYHIGISNFFDLGLDFADFLDRVKDRSFEKAILGCLAPWFDSEVEIFCRSVEEPVKEALLADATIAQGSEETVDLGTRCREIACHSGSRSTCASGTAANSRPGAQSSAKPGSGRPRLGRRRGEASDSRASQSLGRTADTVRPAAE